MSQIIAPNGGATDWVHVRPSPTIVGTFRPDIVAAPGYRPAGSTPRQRAPGSVLVSIEQAAALQSYPNRIERSTNMRTDHAVLDLFAGTGVGVACQWLGVPEYGVEWMPEANAVRAANGMTTIYENVWDVHLLDALVADGLTFDTIWASPPCQTFSMAGSGAGRKALDDVLSVIHDKAYLHLPTLRERSEELGDERIGLVLSPLHYVARFNPTYVAFEQVPPVLPVWEAMAVEMREMGYSVWTGYLHSEQYGVPQTRKRAYLMARNDGVEARPPVPTHSKYYPSNPKRLDEGVLPWVSMAEALGWLDVNRPSPTVTGGQRDRRSGTFRTPRATGDQERSWLGATTERVATR